MELSKEEKAMLQAYLQDFLPAHEKASMLRLAILNLQKMALYARGLSPETHLVDDQGHIQEIKTTEPKAESKKE